MPDSQSERPAKLAMAYSFVSSPIKLLTVMEASGKAACNHHVISPTEADGVLLGLKLFKLENKRERAYPRISAGLTLYKPKTPLPQQCWQLQAPQVVLEAPYLHVQRSWIYLIAASSYVVLMQLFKVCSRRWM